jgi:hypothetical protein
MFRPMVFCTMETRDAGPMVVVVAVVIVELCGVCSVCVL